MELDLTGLRSKALEIRQDLCTAGYRVQTVLLFGSHASGTATDESDIDLAFVSIDFGRDAPSVPIGVETPAHMCLS